MEPNEQLIMWGSVVGFVLPLAISTVNQRRWSSTARGLVAFGGCLIAAAGTVYFEGTLRNGGDLASAFLAIFVTAIGTYKLYWRPSGIAPAVERVTEVSSGS